MSEADLKMHVYNLLELFVSYLWGKPISRTQFFYSQNDNIYHVTLFERPIAVIGVTRPPFREGKKKQKKNENKTEYEKDNEIDIFNNCFSTVQ